MLDLFNLYITSSNLPSNVTVVCFDDLLAFKNVDVDKAIYTFPYPIKETEKYGIISYKAFYFAHFTKGDKSKRSIKKANVICLYHENYDVKNNELFINCQKEPK